MTRTTSQRRRYLEEVVGEIGKVDEVYQNPDGHWSYTLRCRTCWAEPPRGRFIGRRLRMTRETTAEAVAAWLQHLANAHTPTITRDDPDSSTEGATS